MSKRTPGLMRIIAFSALAFAVSTLHAAPVPQGRRLPDMSCRAWVKSKDDAEQRREYLAWIRGVLTGHNYANPGQQVSAVSSGTVENFVDRYCSEKPWEATSLKRPAHERPVFRPQHGNRRQLRGVGLRCRRWRRGGTKPWT